MSRYTEDAAEIAEGVKAGDVVVRAGVHKLTPGRRCARWPRPLNEAI